MFWQCIMSHGRRLTTEHQISHMISPPLKPYKQLLVFRSLSTATPQDHGEDRKGSKPASWCFNEWMKNIYDEFRRKKKEYEDMKYVHRHERILEGYLKYDYHISGFRGANHKSMSVEIRNSPQFVVLVVFGRPDKRSSMVIERHITLPNNDYSKAKTRAIFNSNVGLLVVEIFDFKETEDIIIKVETIEA